MHIHILSAFNFEKKHTILDQHKNTFLPGILCMQEIEYTQSRKHKQTLKKRIHT